ncbi:MAG: tRNA (N(6)-L-threonylcarbamoyladenosine(37)-C(2))-methylthiotransferase MtaB [Clostridia bacterium]|nr:tRNA (N(6)-L-threonylcarbamoyladenosine(37)-C(2))-methylthiotransferase MtaB [Clostridia bacterium]
MNKSVGLYTLGCKVSLYETEAISEAFAEAGYKVCPFDAVCDVYVINTCTVTAESDAKSRKYIRRAIRKNPDAVVIVIGCYSQRSPDEVAAIEGVGAVLGTADKMKCVEIAENLLNSKFEIRNSKLVRVESLDGANFEPMCVKNAPRTRAYVKIEDGCECRCTYCAISGARGPVRSKRAEDVISEVEGLYKNGTLEVVLTGIETGSYGADFDEKYDLADLICELDRRGSCGRIRLGSMAPELLTPDFIDKISDTKIMVPHFHISMQSGSSNVLRGMKRRYNRDMALKNIKHIREKMPDVMLTADLMVGFPGESEEDFLETLAFVGEAGLLDAHVFAYSKREGTPAADYPNQIPEQTKKERSTRLMVECARVRDEILSGVVADGKPLSCILETFKNGLYTSHSDSYIEVVCEGEKGLGGRLVSVMPMSHRDGKIYGKII